MKVGLLTDQAIGEVEARGADGLGFGTYARVLAGAASETRGPFTIGVFGEWGTGKTSLMRLIERELDDKPEIVTVWFNAWRYEQEEHPIVPLVGTIVRSLETHQGFATRFGQTGKNLVRSLRAIAYGFSAKAKVKVPGFAEVEAGFVAKDMIERDERLTPDPLLDRSLYFGAFNSLDEVRLRGDLRVVVLIDDLDRCFPDQAIRLLESIKLVLAQQGFIFILGVARKVIEGYLQHRYATEFGIAGFKGELYLDKIVQLPFHIPPSLGRMNDFCRILLRDQPPEIATELEPVLPVAAAALGGNPRALIRFVNNLLIDLAISQELSGVAEGIPVRFFAVSRCLEHRWPDVFEALTGSDELPAEVATWNPDTYADRAGEGAGPAALVATKLRLDADLRRLLTGRQGVDWLTGPALRNASVRFLLDQQRISTLDTSEVRVRHDALVLYPADKRREAFDIVSALSEAGLRVDFAEDVAMGGDWSEVFGKATDDPATFVVCTSGIAGYSDQQRRQVELLMTGPARVIPVLLPDADPAHLPAAWRELTFVKVSRERFDEDMDALAAAVRRVGRGR
ncbi:P-loop NTPase fold protein [Actinoplanes sp. NPDC051470]|uniref:P-loop NTPase fold protein n=1 Tax=unclassified Actinoplanes TaxID=2626549 RepID=UPI00343D4AE9